MLDVQRELCATCGRPAHLFASCEQAAASAFEAPPAYPLCEVCNQPHKPGKDCPLPVEKGYARNLT